MPFAVASTFTEPVRLAGTYTPTTVGGGEAISPPVSGNIFERPPGRSMVTDCNVASAGDAVSATTMSDSLSPQLSRPKPPSAKRTTAATIFDEVFIRK